MPAYNEIADIDVINGNMDKIDVQMKKNADSAQQSKDIVSDEYSATNTYAVGDYCIHENILYKCKTAITTGEAFDSNKWIQTTCGTEFGGLNSNLTPQTGNITFESDFAKEYGSIDKINGIVYLNISIYKYSDFAELNKPVKVGTLQNGYKSKYSVTMSLRYGFISIGADGTINYTPTNSLTRYFGYSLTTCYIAQ